MDRILAIDIGNTNIVLCVHNGKVWEKLFRVKSSYANCIQVAGEMMRKLDFNKVVISSVVPRLTAHICNEVEYISGITPVIIGITINTGLDQQSIPVELGSDILCNLIAAHHEYPDDYVMVADFGTAFTTETVDPDGKVMGVTIGPGMMTSVKALFQNTAQLPEIRLDLPKTVLGKDTISSIRAGVMYGFAGQVTAIREQVEKELGHKVKLIATGGMSKYITQYINTDKADVCHTLEGARIACLLNS